MRLVGVIYLCPTAEKKDWIPIGRAMREPHADAEIALTLRAVPLTGHLQIVWYDGIPDPKDRSILPQNGERW